MKTLRVAVIGAGANTRARHLPGLLEQPGVRLVGVVNRTPASTARAAADFDIPRRYAHWREAAEDPEADAVVIGTWPDMHARATLAALAAGKHVLCEARMARDAAEAHAMLRAAQARPDQVAQLVPSPFSLEVDATVARFVAEGRLGELLVVEHRPAAGFLDRAAPLHWRQDAARSGVNTLALGIVYEMLLRWVGEATRVLARGRVFARLRRDEQGAAHAVAVPDHLDVLADLACGAHLHLQQSAVTAHRTETGTWLYGDRGVLRFDGTTLFFGDRDADALAPVAIPPEERGGWRVEEEFVQAVRGEAPVRRTTFEDGVRYMEFTEAARRSAARGRAVPLPLGLDGA